MVIRWLYGGYTNQGTFGTTVFIVGDVLVFKQEQGSFFYGNECEHVCVCLSLHAAYCCGQMPVCMYIYIYIYVCM